MMNPRFTLVSLHTNGFGALGLDSTCDHIFKTERSVLKPVVIVAITGTNSADSALASARQIGGTESRRLGT